MPGLNKGRGEHLERSSKITNRSPALNIDVVVQSYPWSKSYVPLFRTFYHTLSYIT